MSNVHRRDSVSGTQAVGVSVRAEQLGSSHNPATYLGTSLSLSLLICEMEKILTGMKAVTGQCLAHNKCSVHVIMADVCKLHKGSLKNIFVVCFRSQIT